VALLADRIVVMVDGRVVVQGTLADLAAVAGVHWGVAEREEVLDPPIERIYRVLVARGRDASPSPLRLVRGDAA
jgi:hypothetical protein